VGGGAPTVHPPVHPSVLSYPPVVCPWQLVASSVRPFVDSLLGPSLDYEKDILWAVHPGGQGHCGRLREGVQPLPGKLQVSRSARH